jgi:hypothetical protein
LEYTFCATLFKQVPGFLVIKAHFRHTSSHLQRLFQISLTISAARGSLAAFFGDEFIKDDI